MYMSDSMCSSVQLPHCATPMVFAQLVDPQTAHHYHQDRFPSHASLPSYSLLMDLSVDMLALLETSALLDPSLIGLCLAPEQLRLLAGSNETSHLTPNCQAPAVTGPFLETPNDQQGACHGAGRATTIAMAAMDTSRQGILRTPCMVSWLSTWLASCTGELIRASWHGMPLYHTPRWQMAESGR